MDKIKLTKITRCLGVLALLALTTPQSANAGFFDWLASFKPKYDINEQIASPFIYASSGLSQNENNAGDSIGKLLLIQDNSLVQTNTVTARTNFNILGDDYKYKTLEVLATGYSSTIDQTDSSPFITASGKSVGDGILAANFLPFGTRIRIPEVFGDKLFVVEDRMNSRYNGRNIIDVWFPERQTALEFGSKIIKIEVID